MYVDSRALAELLIEEPAPAVLRRALAGALPVSSDTRLVDAAREHGLPVLTPGADQ